MRSSARFRAGSLKGRVHMFNRRSQLGMIASAWVLAGCSFASNTDDNIGSVTPIPPAVAESNPLRTLNSRPAAPVLNTGNFPATSGSTTPPGAPRPPPSAAEFVKIDLSAEERRLMLRLIRDALDSTKYPL